MAEALAAFGTLAAQMQYNLASGMGHAQRNEVGIPREPSKSQPQFSQRYLDHAQQQHGHQIATHIVRGAEKSLAVPQQHQPPLTAHERLQLIPRAIPRRLRQQMLKVPEQRFRVMLANYNNTVRRHTAALVSQLPGPNGQVSPSSVSGPFSSASHFTLTVPSSDRSRWAAYAFVDDAFSRNPCDDDEADNDNDDGEVDNDDDVLGRMITDPIASDGERLSLEADTPIWDPGTRQSPAGPMTTSTPRIGMNFGPGQMPPGMPPPPMLPPSSPPSFNDRLLTPQQMGEFRQNPAMRNGAWRGSSGMIRGLQTSRMQMPQPRTQIAPALLPPTLLPPTLLPPTSSEPNKAALKKKDTEYNAKKPANNTDANTSMTFINVDEAFSDYLSTEESGMLSKLESFGLAPKPIAKTMFIDRTISQDMTDAKVQRGRLFVALKGGDKIHRTKNSQTAVFAQ